MRRSSTTASASWRARKASERPSGPATEQISAIGYHRFLEAIRGLPVDQALIDGEAVVLRADGLSDFEAIRTKAGGGRASYVAFDLLALGGKDVRQQPIEDRRAELERIVRDAAAILFSKALAVEGELVFQKACELGCEGVISKRVGSAYWSGRCRNWTKARNPAFQRR